MKSDELKQIVFLGLPGAGKGTHANLLGECFNLSHLSTGEVFRAEIKKETELGILAKQLIDKGNYIPDEFLIQIVENHINNTKYVDGFLLDGFPRTIPQARDYDVYLNKQSKEIDFVIFLDVCEDTAIKRLKKRGEKSSRKDDDSSVIAHRMQVYYDLTAAVVDYYANEEKLIRIYAEGSIQQTHKLVVEAYNDFYKI